MRATRQLVGSRTRKMLAARETDGCVAAHKARRQRVAACVGSFRTTTVYERRMTGERCDDALLRAEHRTCTG